jgi:hypothetical protein
VCQLIDDAVTNHKHTLALDGATMGAGFAYILHLQTSNGSMYGAHLCTMNATDGWGH